LHPSKWVVEELDGIELGHKRLNNRVLGLLEKAAKQPQASFNTMFYKR